MSGFPNWQAWLDLLAARRDTPIVWIALAALVVVLWLHNFRTYPRPMAVARFVAFLLFIVGIVIPLVNHL
ncbi:MAG: hypothetical protein KF716_14930 [Anaerolineae bacterium]|nr:hypothetical protein [Anaerolineae bacterium]